MNLNHVRYYTILKYKSSSDVILLTVCLTKLLNVLKNKIPFYVYGAQSDRSSVKKDIRNMSSYLYHALNKDRQKL